MVDLKQHPTIITEHKPTPKLNKGLGWKKETGKYKLTVESPEVKQFFKAILRAPLKVEVDLEYLLKIWWDQLQLGSCTANGTGEAVMMMEYKEFNEFKELARRFLYYVTRQDVEHQSGDTGATITDAVQAMVNYGACLEGTWPYSVDDFDVKPSDKAYAEGLEYQTLKEVSLTKLDEIKATLSAGYPVVLGFLVFESFEKIGPDGIMSIPKISMEQLLGGHCIVVIGYKIINGVKYLKCRNSWGKTWGDNGNFYMPESYLTKTYGNYACVDDFKVILKQEYMDKAVAEAF